MFAPPKAEQLFTFDGTWDAWIHGEVGKHHVMIVEYSDGVRRVTCHGPSDDPA